MELFPEMVFIIAKSPKFETESSPRGGTNHFLFYCHDRILVRTGQAHQVSRRANTIVLSNPPGDTIIRLDYGASGPKNEIVFLQMGENRAGTRGLPRLEDHLPC
jgi:hypothetical protein